MTGMRSLSLIGLSLALAACTTDKVASTDSASGDSASTDDSAADSATDSGDSGDSGDTGTPLVGDPWGDRLVSYTPGLGAGFGQSGLPDIVLGPPEGNGEAGSTDVVSLGFEGEIVIALDDIELVDGPGVDLLVFENAFPGWSELGYAAVSEDGVEWYQWHCDLEAEGAPGCAGVATVYANSSNGIDATDPETAGGDAFDLADVGLATARYVRIRDAGTSSYDGISGGFDLDAIAVVNGGQVSE